LKVFYYLTKRGSSLPPSPTAHQEVFLVIGRLLFSWDFFCGFFLEAQSCSPLAATPFHWASCQSLARRLAGKLLGLPLEKSFSFEAPSGLSETSSFPTLRPYNNCFRKYPSKSSSRGASPFPLIGLLLVLFLEAIVPTCMRNSQTYTLGASSRLMQ